MKPQIALLIVLVGLLLVPPVDGAESGGKVGLGLASKDGTIEVVLVAPGSPAAKAGVTVGMIVEEIDGVRTVGKGLHECATLVRGQAGTPVILKLRNPDDPKAFMVVLQRE